MSDGWVVVVDGGIGQGRSTLAAARALHAGGYRVAIASSRGLCPAARSKTCSLRIDVPPIDAITFAATITAAADRLDAVEILAATDAAMVTLGVPGVRFLDKHELADRARAAGIPTVPGERFASPTALDAARARLRYPAIVKPVDRSRFPARVLTGPGTPLDLPDDGALLVQPFIRGEQRAFAGVISAGRFLGMVHQRALRVWPDPCGGASAAETIPPDLGLERAVARLLGDYEGIFMAQLVDGRLIDLNARVYGSLPLAMKAGVNIPALWCDARRGEDVAPARARPGVRYRRLDADVRSIARAALSGRPLPPVRDLLPRRGTAHGVGSLDDPAPLLAHVERIVRSRAQRLMAG